MSVWKRILQDLSERCLMPDRLDMWHNAKLNQSRPVNEATFDLTLVRRSCQRVVALQEWFGRRYDFVIAWGWVESEDTRYIYIYPSIYITEGIIVSFTLSALTQQMSDHHRAACQVKSGVIHKRLPGFQVPENQLRTSTFGTAASLLRITRPEFFSTSGDFQWTTAHHIPYVGTSRVADTWVPYQHGSYSVHLWRTLPPKPPD